MSSRSTNTERNELPVEEEDLATAQENLPIPLTSGTQRLAVRWITGARERITEEAPAATGKK